MLYECNTDILHSPCWHCHVTYGISCIVLYWEVCDFGCSQCHDLIHFNCDLVILGDTNGSEHWQQDDGVSNGATNLRNCNFMQIKCDFWEWQLIEVKTMSVGLTCHPSWVQARQIIYVVISLFYMTCLKIYKYIGILKWCVKKSLIAVSVSLPHTLIVLVDYMMQWAD